MDRQTGGNGSQFNSVIHSIFIYLFIIIIIIIIIRYFQFGTLAKYSVEEKGQWSRRKGAMATSTATATAGDNNNVLVSINDERGFVQLVFNGEEDLVEYGADTIQRSRATQKSKQF